MQESTFLALTTVGAALIDKTILYNLIYALAARDGRESALFGDCAPFACEAFERSVAGDYFPELWFELPLAGVPWFDLHVLASHEDLDPNAQFVPETCGGCPDAFSWFAAQDHGVRQLALSWDTSAHDVENPAVQLLVKATDVPLTCGFLEAAGRSDAADTYRAFAKLLPDGWFACYTGVFPRRPRPHLRVECIPTRMLQKSYAEDVGLLERHLRQVGFDEFGDTVLSRTSELAALPFRIEFQFDVEPGGRAGSTIGVSMRFAPPPGTDSWEFFNPAGQAGKLMRQLEAWGLADERWHLLAQTAFATRIDRTGDSTIAFCLPTFVKLRWRDGLPLDAKCYLKAGVQ